MGHKLSKGRSKRFNYAGMTFWVIAGFLAWDIYAVKEGALVFDRALSFLGIIAFTRALWQWFKNYRRDGEVNRLGRGGRVLQGKVVSIDKEYHGPFYAKMVHYTVSVMGEGDYSQRTARLLQRVFKSDPLFFNPEQYVFTGDKVTIYLDPSDADKYYVDMTDVYERYKSEAGLLQKIWDCLYFATRK